MINAEALTKYYADKAAISEVSFEVAKGEILGFLGPNGAGKTTTMRILAGYLPATSGSARIAGFDVVRQSLEARREVGYMPENVPLYSEMTVRSYLFYSAEIKGVPSKLRADRVADAIQKARIEDVVDKIIGKLSKGYRQRVGLAQALVHDPKVLILDEPTVGLDPRQIIETRKLIKALGGNHTIILSTHILQEVGMTCSRVIIIYEGKLVAVDTPDNLTRQLRGGTERVEVEIRGPSAEVLKRLRSLDGVQHAEAITGEGEQRYRLECAVGRSIREEVARAVVQSDWGLLELRSIGMSLEDVFLKLTTREEVPS